MTAMLRVWLGCMLTICATTGAEPLKVERLRCEYKENPQGIDVIVPLGLGRF
jgi:hypothetical protein